MLINSVPSLLVWSCTTAAVPLAMITSRASRGGVIGVRVAATSVCRWIRNARDVAMPGRFYCACCVLCDRAVRRSRVAQDPRHPCEQRALAEADDDEEGKERGDHR